jgi:hypothetical protein
VEAGTLRVDGKVFVLGGYQTLTSMCPRMQILDIATGAWSYGPPLPPGCPLSHAGIASDGVFLFLVSGQPGPACEPGTDRSWALHLETLAWQAMAPLPAVRFASCLDYVDGHLHLISGAMEDRETVSEDHFILKIRDPESAVSSALPSLEDQVWRKGPPIPRGGDHAGALVLDGRIYFVGGEHGHAPMTMDASRCCGTYWAHDFLFRYDPRAERWERLADLPFACSHIESQLIALDGRIVVLGGTGNQDALVDRIQEYDPAQDRWRVSMRALPLPRKGGVVWEDGGFLYFNGGQVAVTPDSRPVLAETMRARIERRSWLDWSRLWS